MVALEYSKKNLLAMSAFMTLINSGILVFERRFAKTMCPEIIGDLSKKMRNTSIIGLKSGIFFASLNGKLVC